MSGTPKYGCVRLRAAQEAALREARRVAAEAERLDRLEAEARERARLLDEARGRADERRRKALAGLAGRSATVPAAELRALETRCRDLEARLAQARDLADIGAAEVVLAAVLAQADRCEAEEARRREEEARRREGAHRAAAEAASVVAGLQGDPALGRWQYHRFADAQALASAAEAAANQGDWSSPEVELQALKALADQMLAAADAAQLRAGRRDVVAAAIADTLAEMGFMVSAPVPQSREHPSSDVVFRAANAAGRAIDVSVPVEGAVYYTVDGFPHTSEPMADGGAAPACDQAEGILNEMRGRLADERGVDSDEILWEGKGDPDRRLRRADELPSSGNARERRL